MIDIQDILTEIKPYVLDWIGNVGSPGTPGGGAYAPSPHALYSAHHSGTLDDSQAPQFLKTDGTRNLTGNLAVDSGITIDGVDISALAAATTPTSRQIIAGAGLTGGGDLSADRTLNVAAGDTSITVAADSIAVALAATSGLQISSGLMLADTIAGAGLTIASKVLAVGAGAGLTVNADDVALTTPGTLSISSSNAASGSHTHAITSSSNPGAAAAILATDSGGNLRLQGLTLDADLAVNGGDLTTNQTTFNLLNATVTTLNFAGAVTSMRIGAGTGLSIGVNKAADSQFDLDVNGSFRAGGYIVGKHALQLPGALMICHYDGAGPYTPPFTDFTGNPTGHLGQVATQSGGVIYRAGKFGKAIQFAEATTNLCTNPSLETNATGWGTNGTSIAKDSTYAYIGASSAKLITGSAAARYATIPGTSVNGTTYTISFRVKRSDSGVVDSGVVSNVFVGNVAFTAKFASLEDNWYLVYGTGAGGASTTTHGITFTYNGTVYIDAVQLEAKAYLTPYCDGSLGTGHSWSGTAHASTSARTDASLTYPITANIVDATGSISLWVFAHSLLGGAVEGIVNWIKHGTPATSGFLIRSTTSKQVQVVISKPATENLTSSAVTESAWHHVVFTWSSGGCTLYVDGAQAASTANTFVASALTVINVGTRPGFDFANGLMDDLCILNRAMTAAEVRAVYESNAPVFAETSTFSFRDPGSRVWMDSNGIFAKTTSDVPAFALVAASINATIIGGASETLDPGDLLIGDNNASKANIWWDASAGKINFRGGTTVQGYIDTTGAATFGAGGVKLDSTGIYFDAPAAATSASSITFKTGSTVTTTIAGTKTGAGTTTADLTIDVNDPTNQNYGTMQFFARNNAAGFSFLGLYANATGVFANILATSGLRIESSGGGLPAAMLDVRGEVRMDVTTLTSARTGGAAAALPANPVGYMKVNISGTDHYVPYYN